jgi:ATP synthase protein I
MTRERDSETETIARKAQRMEEARRRRRESAWYGLGMFGLVGWSVAVPIVAGIALGSGSTGAGRARCPGR